MTGLHDIAAGEAVAHLTPESWNRANRRLVCKALAEWSHERILTPDCGADGGYVVWSDDGSVAYRFDADRLALDHWRIDADRIRRQTRAGKPLLLDSLALVLDLRDRLGLGRDALPLYLEELTSTLAMRAYHLTRIHACADEIAQADFQTIERSMSEGHPCFVANSGRLGFDSADYLQYAPETATPVRLLWVAARRTRSTFTCSSDLDYDGLVTAELDESTVARFRARLSGLGLDLDDYHLIPTHPWQWWHRLSVTFAADIARRHLVYAGCSDDRYQAQQSVRTFFNTSTPTRHYVKTALSVLNMGFMRGLSAGYMKATPAINDWLVDRIADDEVLTQHGFAILRERAAIGYHSEHFEAASPPGSPYLKMLAALWRESPVSMLKPGQRLMTMASLLHVDDEGRPLATALIRRSGLETGTWLRHYVNAYLVPILHCFYAHGLAVMPHGENVILVLENDVPRRVLLKDIAEEILVIDSEVHLPPGTERIRADIPEDLKSLFILTDVLDCFLRFLNAVLVTAGALAEHEFWSTVAACVREYQTSVPRLADRFHRYDMFVPEFPLLCLNRLQLRNNQQMVDPADPAGSWQFAGTLNNPLAPFQ